MYENGRKMYWISKSWIQNNEGKQFIRSNNESEQIMKLTHRVHVCLIIFLNFLFWYNEFTEARQDLLYIDTTVIHSNLGQGTREDLTPSSLDPFFLEKLKYKDP